ncbi:MAG: EamA family transporter [Acidobacteriota bacterium]
MTEAQRAFRLKMILSFTAVYLIWGSTYLAIRFAIETLPTFTMASVRFVIAGLVLYGWARWRGAKAPTGRQWRHAAIIGGLLLLGGNGLVVWAEHYIPSGWAALLVGTEPLWIVLLLMLSRSGERPTPRTVFAIVVGFVGVAVLTAPGNSPEGGGLYWPAAVAVPLAALSWAIGSLYSRRADMPESNPLATSLQMLTGGALLGLTGAGFGEFQNLDPSAFSLTSLAALAYLIVFGSLIAFSAYAWMVRNVDPTLVATYAYVNPVVAVILGWLFAGEPVGWRTLIAGGFILGAVALLSKRPRKVEKSEPEDEPVALSEPCAAG